MFHNKIKNISYIEFASTGHRPIWLLSVIKAFSKLPDNWRLNIWVPSKFIDFHHNLFSDYVNHEKFNKGNILFKEPIYIDSYDRNVDLVKKINGKRTLTYFEIIRYCTAIDQADICFVGLNLTYILKDIAFTMPGTIKTKITGVMDTTLHYGKFSSPRTKAWLTKRKYLREYARVFLAVRRSFLGKIYLLDPYAPFYYNSIMLTSKFHFIPDFYTTLNFDNTTLSQFNLPKNKITLLISGNIDSRKGIFNFIEAIKKASREMPHIVNQISIVIAGVVMAGFREKFYSVIDEFKATYPNILLTVVDGYLSDIEFNALLFYSDVICLPYINSIGSSGILASAAAHGKFLLTTDFGLIGEFVRQFGLGATFDESNLNEILYAIVKALNETNSDKHTRINNSAEFVRSYLQPLDNLGDFLLKSIIEQID